MMKEKNNSKKGITLVSLVVTIVILLILSTVSIYGIKSSNNINPYNEMIADINLLEDKILVYYNKYGEIPKTDENSELYGCVAVNEEFARVLLKLMGKFTFEGIENSWLKLCYY